MGLRTIATVSCNQNAQESGIDSTVASPRRTKRPSTKKPVRRDRGRPRGAPVVESVLDETMRLLAREGLAGLRVESVAEAAGVNKTSIYRRWPTRESLVAAAITRAQSHLTVPPVTGSLEGDLRAVVGAVGRFLSSTAGRATLSVALSGGLDADTDGLRDRLEPAAVASARGIFAEAAARGECAVVDEPEAVVFALVGAVLHRVLLERRAVSAAWVEATVRRALRGVIGDASAAQEPAARAT